MSGEQLKIILRKNNVNLSALASDLGFDNDQRLHSALRARDVKSGLIEQIAKALGKTVSWFYEEDTELNRLKEENQRLKKAIGDLLET